MPERLYFELRTAHNSAVSTCAQEHAGRGSSAPSLQNSASGLPDTQRRWAKQQALLLGGLTQPSSHPDKPLQAHQGHPCRREQHRAPINMCARDHAAAALLRFHAARLRTFFFFVPLAMLARAVPQTRDAQRPRLSGTAWRPQDTVVRLHASTRRMEPQTAGWPVRSQLLRSHRLLLRVALPGLQYFGACWRFEASNALAWSRILAVLTLVRTKTLGNLAPRA